jgi:hypothetical protein
MAGIFQPQAQAGHQVVTALKQKNTGFAPPASVPMAAVMTMAPVVTMSRPPPAIARVGVSAAVVLAICVRIELGAPAWIGNDVLR